MLYFNIYIYKLLFSCFKKGINELYLYILFICVACDIRYESSWILSIAICIDEFYVQILSFQVGQPDGIKE